MGDILQKSSCGYSWWNEGVKCGTSQCSCRWFPWGVLCGPCRESKCWACKCGNGWQCTCCGCSNKEVGWNTSGTGCCRSLVKDNIENFQDLTPREVVEAVKKDPGNVVLAAHYSAMCFPPAEKLSVKELLPISTKDVQGSGKGFKLFLYPIYKDTSDGCLSVGGRPGYENRNVKFPYRFYTQYVQTMGIVGEAPNVIVDLGDTNSFAIHRDTCLPQRDLDALGIQKYYNRPIMDKIIGRSTRQFTGEEKGDMLKTIRDTAKHILGGDRVLMYCFSGDGRSGTMAICTLLYIAFENQSQEIENVSMASILEDSDNPQETIEEKITRFRVIMKHATEGNYPLTTFCNELLHAFRDIKGLDDPETRFKALHYRMTQCQRVRLTRGANSSYGFCTTESLEKVVRTFLGPNEVEPGKPGQATTPRRLLHELSGSTAST